MAAALWNDRLRVKPGARIGVRQNLCIALSRAQRCVAWTFGTRLQRRQLLSLGRRFNRQSAKTLS